MENLCQGLCRGFSSLGLVGNVSRRFGNCLAMIFSLGMLECSTEFLLCILFIRLPDFIRLDEVRQDSARIVLADTYAKLHQCLSQVLCDRRMILVLQTCSDIPDGRFEHSSDGQDNAGKHQESFYFYRVFDGTSAWLTFSLGVFSKELYRNIINADRTLRDAPKKIIYWKKGQKLGDGAFGKVYEAFINNEKMAVKVIKLPDRDSENDTCRVLQKIADAETRLVGLSHGNLMKVFHVGNKSNTITVIMELLNGKTLCRLVKHFKDMYPFEDGLPEKTLKCFSKQICSALCYLHNHKPCVIHRDIKGSNIMVTNGGRTIKLIDFGLSITLKNAATHWSAVSLEGTRPFMAPELFGSEGKIKYCPESDIWAFGCTFYQMAVGSAPHSDCTNEMQIMWKIYKFGAPSLPIRCSSSMKKFYATCVQYDRKKRKTATQLLQDDFLASSVVGWIDHPLY